MAALLSEGRHVGPNGRIGPNGWGFSLKYRHDYLFDLKFATA